MQGPNAQEIEEGRRELIAELHRSFALIYLELVDSRGQDRKAAYLSAFLMSVEGQWLIVTAGHCVRNIVELLARGYRFTRQYIEDTVGTAMRAPFTFSWEHMRPWYIQRDGMDYGVLFVDPFSKRNLQAAEKRSLDESIWNHPVPPLDAPYVLYWLVAVAQVDTTTDISRGTALMRLFLIDRLTQRPDDFEEEPAVETVWGTIRGEDSIMGTSGGAVYAVSYGSGACQPVAIQSSWFKETRHVRAPTIRPLARMLIDEGILRERRHLD